MATRRRPIRPADLPGISVGVTPSTFTIAPGASKTYTVRFAQATAAPYEYAFGSLTWTGNKGHVVRSPFVIRPVALAAPSGVSGSGGPISYNVTFGFAGPFTASARGLVPATITAGNVADDPTNGSCSLTAPNAQQFPVVVPAGTTYARFCNLRCRREHGVGPRHVCV